MKPFSSLYAALAASALALAASGCDSSHPVGGLTNPNPGAVVDSDKASSRTDLPVPSAAKDDPIREAVSSSPGNTRTSTGVGGGDSNVPQGTAKP